MILFVLYTSYRSRIHACPSPPSAHAAISAKRWPSSCKRRLAVVTNRDPVAPNGWPIARDPPWIFILSTGISPTLFPPKLESANFWEDMAVRLDNLASKGLVNFKDSNVFFQIQIISRQDLLWTICGALSNQRNEKLDDNNRHEKMSFHINNKTIHSPTRVPQMDHML